MPGPMELGCMVDSHTSLYSAAEERPHSKNEQILNRSGCAQNRSWGSHVKQIELSHAARFKTRREACWLYAAAKLLTTTAVSWKYHYALD